MGKNFIALLGAQIFVTLGGLTIPPLIPFLQPKLDLNYTQVGSLMTFLYFGAMLASSPAGWLTDRLGVKKLILFCQGLMGISVVLFSFVENYLAAITLTFFMGLGYGMVNPPTTKGIMLLVNRKNRGLAMSLKQAGVPIGGAIAAALLPPLALLFSWRFSLVIIGVMVILAGLLSFVLYRQDREIAPSSPIEVRETIQGDWIRIFKNKNFILLSTAGAFCSLQQIALVTYLILFLKDVKKFDLILAAFCLTLTNIGGILGRIFWGMVSDRLFKRSRKIVLKLLVFLIFLLSLVLGLDMDLPSPIIYLILFIFGLSAIGWNGVFHAFVGELSGNESIGKVTGLCMTIVFIGNLAGPFLFGRILDMTGSYSPSWFFLSATMVGAFFLFSLIQEEKISIILSRRSQWE